MALAGQRRGAAASLVGGCRQGVCASVISGTCAQHFYYSRIHWQVVVNAVQEEVQHEEEWPVWEHVVDVEQEAVKRVFEDSPDDDTRDEAAECREHGLHRDEGCISLCCFCDSLKVECARYAETAELLQRAVEECGADGDPDHWHDVPRCTREDLEVPRPEEAGGTFQVAWTVDLLEVELLVELGIPDLHDQRPVQI